VPSTVVRRIAYDEASQTLSVWFVPSGLRYDYFDVPPDVVAAFRSARSKGSFFNTEIRGRFAFAQGGEAVASRPNFATIAKL